ncbi:hypothetical protein FoTM2_007910 [Fusarium oxysporum f. sp. vasinfectum]|nr:hypothetical protein FoTM2_007910 [Fusarium oxysporum f. sp. vasinfectum]
MLVALEARAVLRLEQHKKTLGFGGSGIPFTKGGSLDQAIADLDASVSPQPESSSSWISDALHIAVFLAAKAYIVASEREPSLAQVTSYKAKEWDSKFLENPAATPLEQIRAVHNVLLFFTSSDPSMLRWQDWAANIALRQLPHASSRELSRESQQEMIRSTSGVASSICSLSVMRGRVEDAVRRIENFQKPIPVKQLQAQAKDGPIVIVNVSNIGSDAIIMRESELIAIPLPDMKKNIPPLLQKSFGRLRSSELTLPFEHSRDAEHLSRDTSRSKLLTWLWKTCVAPVVVKLRELGELTGTTNGDPPRVWWIGAGAAASLPFHAAGDINRMSNANLGPDDLEKQLLSCLDWMTPSYAASIKSLQYAKSRAANLILEEEPAILVVAMPTTPGHSSLLGVETEKKATKRPIPVSNSSVAHFACHGMSHPTDLDASNILLQKQGSNDRPELDRLTVGKILDITSHVRLTSAILSPVYERWPELRRVRENFYFVNSTQGSHSDFSPKAYSPRQFSEHTAPSTQAVSPLLDVSLERTAAEAKYVFLYWRFLLPNNGQSFPLQAARHSTTGWTQVVQDLSQKHNRVHMGLLANALALVSQQTGQTSVIAEAWRMYSQTLQTLARSLPHISEQGAAIDPKLTASALFSGVQAASSI